MQKNRKSATIPEKHNFLPTFLAFLFPDQYLGIYNSHNSFVFFKKIQEGQLNKRFIK